MPLDFFIKIISHAPLTSFHALFWAVALRPRPYLLVGVLSVGVLTNYESYAFTDVVGLTFEKDAQHPEKPSPAVWIVINEGA